MQYFLGWCNKLVLFEVSRMNHEFDTILLEKSQSSLTLTKRQADSGLWFICFKEYCHMKLQQYDEEVRQSRYGSQGHTAQTLIIDQDMYALRAPPLSSQPRARMPTKTLTKTFAITFTKTFTKTPTKTPTKTFTKTFTKTSTKTPTKTLRIQPVRRGVVCFGAPRRLAPCPLPASPNSSARRSAE